MTLQELRLKLQAQIDTAQAVTIDDATLGTTGVDSLIAASPLLTSSIVVASTETILPPASTLTVTGTTSFLGQRRMPATVVFKEGAVGILFTLTAQLPSGWTFSSSFSPVNGTVFDQLVLKRSTFVFTNDPVPASTSEAGLIAGLNYAGLVAEAAATFAQALQFFGITVPPPTLSLRGALTMGGGSLSIDVRALLGASATIGPIALGGGYLGATFSKKAASLTAGGSVTVAGQPLDLSAVLDQTRTLTFHLTSAITLGGLADLVPLLGASGWQNLLPPELSRLGGFDLQSAAAVVSLSGASPAVTSLRVVMGIRNPWPIVSGSVTVTSIQATWSSTTGGSPWTIDIAASTTLGKNIEFDLDIVTRPALTVSGTLAVARQFDLPTLVSDVAGGGLSVPPDLVTLTLDRVAFVAVPSSSSYAIHATGTIDISIFGESELTLREIVVTLTKNAVGGTSGTLTATLLLGGASFAISAGIQKGIVFNGSLDAPVKATAFLSQLTRQTVAVPPEVPDFELQSLSVEIDTSRRSVSLAAEIEAKWQIPLANASPSIDVSFGVSSAVQGGRRSYTGYVKGKLQIGQNFDIVYTFGNNVSILSGTWSGDGGGLSYASVAASLGIDVGGVPDPLGMSMPDFGLTSASLTIDFNQPAVRFTANSAIGNAYFAASKGNDRTWGFFLGVASASSWTFSSLPGGLGSALGRFDFATFTQAFLVIATAKGTLTSAQLPPLGSETITVVPGLNVGVAADLTTGTHPLATALQKTSGIDRLFIQGAIARSTSDTFIEASIAGQPLAIPGAGGLSLSQPYLKLNLSPALTLGGSALIPWSGSGGNQQVNVGGMFTINADSADFGVNVKFPALGAPVGFVGISIEEIGATIGIAFEPPSIELGLEAMFVLGSTKSNDQFAFVFDVTADAINPKLLQARISELDLQTMFSALVPQITLPAALGTGITFKNFFIYWCDEPTMLPDGSQAQPGFGFNGTVNAFDYIEATAALMVKSSQGMTGSFSLAPVTVTAGGVRVVSISGAGGGHLQFSFSTISSPYMAWSGAVNLLGIEQVSSKGEITSGGFDFDVTVTLASVSSTTLACSYAGATNFSASGTFSIDALDITLGPWKPGGITVIPRIHIHGPSASLGLSIAVNPHVIAELGVHFSFSWDFDVDVSFNLSLADIESALSNLWSAVVSWLQNHLDQVFAGMGNDLQQWIDAVAGGILEFENGVDDIANALYNFFEQKAPEALARALTAAGAGFEDAARALHKYCGIAWSEAVKILGGAAKSCAMKSAFALLHPTSASGPGSSAVLPRTAGPLGLSVLFDLKRTARGRVLLNAYLLNQPELEWLLGRQIDVRAALRRRDANAAAELPIREALEVLGILERRGSGRLREAITTCRAVLEPRAPLSYPDFLLSLRTG